MHVLTFGIIVFLVAYSGVPLRSSVRSYKEYVYIPLVALGVFKMTPSLTHAGLTTILDIKWV